MKVSIKNWSIGPKHDPYGAEELTVVTTAGKVVTYYRDGLGNNRVEVDGEVAASIHAYNVIAELTLKDLFEEYAGISYSQAYKAWERLQTSDPFKGIDPYYGHA